MRNRKKIRLDGFDYSSNRLYFVTNCVKNNVCFFGHVLMEFNQNLSQKEEIRVSKQSEEIPIKTTSNGGEHVQLVLNEFGKCVEHQILWLEQQYPYVIIHEYVVMPNHFHFIIEIDSFKVAPTIKIKSLSSLMGVLKSLTTRKIKQLGGIDFEWHRSFHDHIIRNGLEYERIKNYIRKNPKKWLEDKFYQIN